jgi:hypothetical protein
MLPAVAAGCAVDGADADDKISYTARLNHELRSTGFPPGYAGYMPAARDICGESFGRTCVSARQARETPGSSSLSRTDEFMFSSRSVAGAAKVFHDGPAIRHDLQHRHTKDVARESGQMMKEVVRAAGRRPLVNHPPASAEGSSRRRRGPEHSPAWPSYDPGTTVQSTGRRWRPDPKSEKPAGLDSYDLKLERLRHIDYAKARFLAKKTIDIPSAIIR